MQHALLICIALLVSACSAKPYVVQPANEFSHTGTNKIYVVSHGWHTGFVIPSADTYKLIPELQDRFGNTASIEFGWGDKGFYQAQEITSGLTVKAIFWPTESVIHAVSIPTDVHTYFTASTIKAVCLTDSELHSLIEFVSRSFERDDQRKIIPQKNGIYGNSQFYKGIGNYYLMNTCNKWTAKGLKSTGLDLSPTFKLTASSVMNYLDGETFCQSISNP